MVVNDFLIEYFPNIIDYNFTAKVENEFDDVAEGTLEWTESIDKFYTTFHPNVESVSKLRLDRKVCELRLGNDPKSGKPVSVKITRSLRLCNWVTPATNLALLRLVPTKVCKPSPWKKPSCFSNHPAPLSQKCERTVLYFRALPYMVLM